MARGFLQYLGLLMGLCRYRSLPTGAHAITGLLCIDIYSPLPRGSDPVTQNTADAVGREFTAVGRHLAIDAAAASATKHEPRPQDCAPAQLSPRTEAQPQTARRSKPSAHIESRRALGPRRSGARRRLIRAEIDAAPPTPQMEAHEWGNELVGSSPTRALALRRSPPPLTHSCHISHRRARLSSRAAATACELRPSHAGLHSHYRAARQPDGDGSRRSAPPTSRDDNRWPLRCVSEPTMAV